MTIKDLYDWAVERGCEDFTIQVRDYDGEFTPDGEIIEPVIDEDEYMRVRLYS